MWRGTVKISGETDAAVEETVTVTGYHAAFLRNMFKGVAVPERAVLLQRELSPLGGAMQVQSLEIDNLENREQPLVFRASYLVRGRFRNADSLLLGRVACALGTHVSRCSAAGEPPHAI